jgi:hypothetical protein
MKRCGVCQRTDITDGGENCRECDYALDDARLNPPSSPHAKTGIVISGYDDDEVDEKREALKLLMSAIAGGEKMSKELFEQACECVGIAFCYECGLIDAVTDSGESEGANFQEAIKMMLSNKLAVTNSSPKENPNTSLGQKSYHFPSHSTYGITGISG